MQIAEERSNVLIALAAELILIDTTLSRELAQNAVDKAEAGSDTYFEKHHALAEVQWIDAAEHILGEHLPFLDRNLGPITVQQCAEMIADIHALNWAEAGREAVKRQMIHAYNAYVMTYQLGNMSCEKYFNATRLELEDLKRGYNNAV